MAANWSVQLCCVDGGSVPVESFLECGLGFPYVLYPINSASDEIYNISGSACDVALGLVRKAGRVAGESVTLVNVYFTYDAPVAGTFEGAMLYGRRMVSEGGHFSTNNEVPEIGWASVC